MKSHKSLNDFFLGLAVAIFILLFATWSKIADILDNFEDSEW